MVQFTDRESGGGRAQGSLQTKAKRENIRQFKILGCRSFFCQMVPLITDNQLYMEMRQVELQTGPGRTL